MGTIATSEAYLRPPLPPRNSVSGLNILEFAEGSFHFPQSHRLIVTTTRGVYEWDASGISEIFHSSSEGIVAAKRLGAETNMLAVADNQVVVLHEIKGTTHKSYRLKGSQVG